jgi:hypothetical protein
MLGEVDDPPVLPVLPLFPEFPLSPEFSLSSVEPEEELVAAPPDDWLAVLAEPFPGCSCATAMPMPTVAPVVANRATRVRLRRRERAWSLLAPALGSIWADIS